MKNTYTIAEAGLWVALVNRSDAFHSCAAAVQVQLFFRDSLRFMDGTVIEKRGRAFRQRMA